MDMVVPTCKLDVSARSFRPPGGATNRWSTATPSACRTGHIPPFAAGCASVPIRWIGPAIPRWSAFIRRKVTGFAARLGKKSMVGWIGAVRPSRRPLWRPPQDEELSQCHQSLILILRSAQRRVSKEARPLCSPSSQFLPSLCAQSILRAVIRGQRRAGCCNREHHYIAVTPITKVASQLKLTNSAFPKTCME
jgi:hypothetical protein